MKVIFYFEGKNKEEFVINKNSIVVGRSKECDICTPYEGFSRRHALIELNDGEFFITDLNSTNGVLIDGNKIPPSKRVPIKTFLTLQIGTSSRVELIDESLHSPKETMSLSETAGLPDTRIPKRNSHNETGSLTRAIKLPNQKKDRKTEGLNIIKIGLLPVLILAGAIYFSDEFTSSEQPPAHLQETEIKKVQGPPIIEPFFLPKALLLAAKSSKNCKDKNASWCLAAGLAEENIEGIVEQGRSLIAYMNMTELMRVSYSNQFNQMTEIERLKTLMLKRILESSILNSLTTQTSLDNLQVVGFFQGKPNMMLAIKFKRNLDMTKLDTNSSVSAINKVIQEGNLNQIEIMAGNYEILHIN